MSTDPVVKYRDPKWVGPFEASVLLGIDRNRIMTFLEKQGLQVEKRPPGMIRGPRKRINRLAFERWLTEWSTK